MTQSANPVPSNQIHLWLVADTDITDAALLHRYSQWLSPAEKEKWKRYRFAVNQHQFLITRALVRSVLSGYVPACDETEWQFVTNEYGRPEIANRTDESSRLQFNVSHTNGLIVMAVCQDGEIGVDIENTTRRGETVSLAERFFSGRECNQLNELANEDQRARFFDLWTLKESYIKARGLGLAIPLNSFSFEFEEPVNLHFNVKPMAKDHAQHWQFWQVDAPPDYRLAVAHRNGQDQTPMELHMTTALPGLEANFQPCVILRSRLPG